MIGHDRLPAGRSYRCAKCHYSYWVTDTDKQQMSPFICPNCLGVAAAIAAKPAHSDYELGFRDGIEAAAKNCEARLRARLFSVPADDIELVEGLLRELGTACRALRPTK